MPYLHMLDCCLDFASEYSFHLSLVEKTGIHPFLCMSSTSAGIKIKILNILLLALFKQRFTHRFISIPVDNDL